MANYTPTMKTNFKVEIDGVDYGNFISVTGLGATAEITDDIGGIDRNARKIPGKVKYPVVTLTRNSDPKDTILRDWWKTVERGTPERKAVSVVLFDRNGVDEISRRNLFECVPCGWDMSDLNSSESGSITESISIVYEDGDWA
ncbi:phage tail protein [Sediminispirochaeta bajacaliforniensis]|uniref:phage tail protein n=1 Tax=Sediminispirochaeta bajacaliforniensis TaxID=148 RepID=UPI00038035CD|nr:phage tail protein [Sediminispirochaeta bajacaliforniensis]